MGNSSVVVVVAIVAGLALLAVAPGRFINAAASLAERWRVSPVVIGVFILGLGTSAPEILVSGLAAFQGSPGVGIGNVVGSNIANLALILGVAGLIGRIGVAHGTVRTELPLVAAATVAFAFAVQDGLTVAEGAGLAVGLVVALAIVARRARAHDPDDEELAAEVAEYIRERPHPPITRLIIMLVVTLVAIVGGGQLLVWGAVEFADELNLSGGFVGMTLVAVGTSLPELVTSITAMRSGEDQLVVGNVLGSNLFNCLAVGAVVGFADAGTIDDTSLTTGGVWMMLGVTAAAAVAMVSGRGVTRWEAGALLVAYLALMPFLA